jgi:hypothetical protein
MYACIHFIAEALVSGYAQNLLKRESLCFCLDYVCSFGANLLHLGNVGKQVSRRFLGLQLLGHFVSYLLGLSNAHTSMGATFAL